MASNGKAGLNDNNDIQSIKTDCSLSGARQTTDSYISTNVDYETSGIADENLKGGSSDHSSTTCLNESSSKIIELGEHEIVKEGVHVVDESLSSDDENEGSSTLEMTNSAPPRRERLRSHYGDHFNRQLRAFEHSVRTPEAQERKSRLFNCLNGSIQFYLTGSKDRFYIIGNGLELSVKDGVLDKPDCIISISPRDLQGVIDGNLNAQVALISDKVRVEGNTGLAIYAFNLVHL